jgi:hypothetical protein
MRRVWIPVLTIAIVIVVSAYFLMQKETIVFDSETDFTSSQTNPDVLSSKDYIINYSSGSTKKYTIQSLIFKDSASAESYADSFMNITSSLTADRTSMEVDEFKGYLFNTLHIDSGRVTGVGLLLRRETTLLYAFGGEKDPLIKVTKWFIERY